MKKPDWKAIQSLVEQGIPYKQVSEQHGVNNSLIRKRASLEKWNTPKRVEERIEQLRKEQLAKSNGGQETPILSQVERNEENLDLIAKTWLDRAEDHRLVAWKIASKGMKRAFEKDIPVLDWNDVEKVDKLGRRSVGLDGQEGALSVNIGLQLVNSRIQKDDLPLDAVEVGK